MVNKSQLYESLPLEMRLAILNPIQIDNELASRSLAEFVKQAWHVLEPGTPYIHGWHLDAMCEHLEAITNGEITRLLINVPPGTMKSMLTTVFWPAWEWGAKGLSHKRFVGASHEQSLAIRDNLKMRRLVESEWYQARWPISLMADQNAKLNFQNDKGGFRQACAVKSMTGVRGNTVCWDDPHNVEGSHSPVDRATAIRVFKETLTSRLVDPISSAIVIVMQRLHEGDVSGYILAKDLGYTHLCLPMEFEPKRKCYTSIGFEDPRTYEGELLFPERFPDSVVQRDKNVMGSRATAGQFQQSPAPAGGSIFEETWLNWYGEITKYSRIVISWDTGFKENELNDPSVATVWGEIPEGYHLLEVVRKRMGYPELRKKSEALAEKWSSNKYLFTGNVQLLNLIEDKASGQSLIQDLTKSTKLNIVAINPESDKITRASTCSPQVEAGKVYLKTGAPWVDDYVSELTVFPNGNHDDQVDSTSQFLNWASAGVAKMTDLFFDE